MSYVHASYKVLDKIHYSHKDTKVVVVTKKFVLLLS